MSLVRSGAETLEEVGRRHTHKPFQRLCPHGLNCARSLLWKGGDVTLWSIDIRNGAMAMADGIGYLGSAEGLGNALLGPGRRCELLEAGAVFVRAGGGVQELFERLEVVGVGGCLDHGFDQMVAGDE